jgi:hypothetical protein
MSFGMGSNSCCWLAARNKVQSAVVVVDVGPGTLIVAAE